MKGREKTAQNTTALKTAAWQENIATYSTSASRLGTLLRHHTQDCMPAGRGRGRVDYCTRHGGAGLTRKTGCTAMLDSSRYISTHRNATIVDTPPTKDTSCSMSSRGLQRGREMLADTAAAGRAG